MPKIKVKAANPDEEYFDHQPVELDPSEWEPVEEPYDPDAKNEDFDRTYEGKAPKKPLVKRWWFWLLLILLLLALLYGLSQYLGTGRGSLENVSVSATGASATSHEATTVQTIEVKEYVIPAGAAVVKGSKGWGLYDYYGNLISGYTGIASNDRGTWYLNDGIVDFSYTGNLSVGGTVYPVNGGKVDVGNPVNVTEPSSYNAYTQSEASEKQLEAVEKAKEHLKEYPMSRKWLIAQLKTDGYADNEAEYGADNCGADWNEQAYYKALENLKLTTFSYNDMVAQLEFEGFTHDQAESGAAKAGL